MRSHIALYLIAAPLCALPLAANAQARVGPNEAQLAKALAEYNAFTQAKAAADRKPAAPTVEIAGVRCERFEEEPTEFECQWRQRSGLGAWETFSSYLAVDGRGYQMIDQPAPVKPKR